MQGELMVDTGFWGGIVPDNAGHHNTLQAMVDAGVLGFKSFMIPSGVAPCWPLKAPYCVCGGGLAHSL